MLGTKRIESDLSLVSKTKQIKQISRHRTPLVNRLYHRYSIPHFPDNVKFLSTLVGNGVLGAYDGNAGYCSEKGGNVLYCSMGSEHYVSHAGIGFGGFIYIMFYCSVKLQTPNIFCPSRDPPRIVQRLPNAIASYGLVIV